MNPHITLDIFQLIETNEGLLLDYMALKKHYKEVNPTIGKTIRQYFDLRNDKMVPVAGQCNLIKSYMCFHISKYAAAVYGSLQLFCAVEVPFLLHGF